MLAAKLEYDYYPEELIEEKPAKKAIKGKKNLANNKRKSRRKLLSLGLSLLVMSFGLFILFGYANISKINLDINEMEKIIGQLESEKSGLTADLEGIKARRKIADEAIYKLGMTYPKEDQIVYISINNLEEVAENGLSASSLLASLNKVLGLFASLF